MNRKMLLFMIILLTGLFAVGNAQDVWDKKSYNTPDSADLLPNSGRMIFNGRLIEPPYEITVENDTIKINKVPLISERTPIDFVVDKHAEQKYCLMKASKDSFEIAYKNVGFDSAVLHMIPFFNSSEIVDSAYIDVHYGFMVKFKKSIGPEAIWFCPPLSESEIQKGEQHRDSALIKRAIRIEKAVGNGNLVILGKRGGVTYLKHAQKRIKEINRIMALDELSREGKLIQLRRITKHDYHSESILQNWKK